MAVHSVSYCSLQVSVCSVKPSMWIYLHILLVIWTSCYNTSVTGEPQVIGSSEAVLAKVGDDVILPCYIEPPVDVVKKTVEWTRPDLKPIYVHVLQDGRDISIDKNPLYKQRTFLFADDELKRGNISLKLIRVKLSDEGEFKCYVPGWKNFSLIQLFVGAVVQPVISLNGPKGDGLSLKCDSGCWYPKPEVSWLDSEGNNITAEPSVTVKRSQHCYEVQRDVTVRRGTNVTCRVHLSHINHTNTVETSAEGEISASVAKIGPNGGFIAVMIIFAAAVLLLLGYFYRKKKQTGIQKYNNAAAHFVMQHRAELIPKVSRVEDILNILGPKVTPELDAEIKEEKTSMDQMMRLYREILQPGGAEVQAAFYDALKEHQPDLLNTLEHPATPRPKVWWSQWTSPVLCGGGDIEDGTTKQDAGEHLTDEDERKKATFVKQHWAELIEHVSRVMAIVDSLGCIVNDELRTKIEAEKTRKNQMRTLYTVMTDERNKATFYNALKQHEPLLLEWLEKPLTQDAVDLTPEEKARFVEENGKHLITNISRVMAILDALGSMVHPERYAEIQEEKISMDQMWILYREILQPGGPKVRAAFYNALKDHQPHLLKILVSTDMPDSQDIELKPLINPSDESAASLCKQEDKTTEPSHVVNQLDLNRKVKMVSSILELLFTEDVTMAKMKKLYEILDSRIAEDVFYKVLEEHKKFLLDNLKNPPCWRALKELDDETFQVFKLYLQQPENLKGLDPLPESLLENADRMDTADLIMQTYHREGDQIVKNVLEKIKQLPYKSTPEGPEVDNSQPVSESEKEKDQQKDNNPAATVCHFVDQHRDDLVKRVKMVAPILDLLLAEDVIKDYSNVMCKTTTMEKMEELYKLLDSRRAKDVFYKGLREHEPFLLEDLKNPPLSGSNAEKEKGLEVVNPLSVSGSKEEKGPQRDPPSPTSDIEKEKGSKQKKPKGPMLRFQVVIFVDKERDSLIKRVTHVEPILDHLFAKEVISEEEKSDVMSKPKTVDQMRSLYEILNNNGPKAKNTFYKGLQVHEKDLLEKL